MDTSMWTDIAAVLAACVALLTFIKAVIEYMKQGAQKRYEMFNQIRQRFKQDEMFKEICDLLERDDHKLRDIPFKEKRDFLGLFEEISLMLNSNLLSKEVAHYMFGYYAIRCWHSDNFWHDVNRDSIYWIVFKKFATDMKIIENSFDFKASGFRF